MNKKEMIFGGIAGGITDPDSPEAEKHAKMYYEEIRKMTTDVDKISNNTSFSKVQILLVKNYLFMLPHELETGFKRFDPCFAIAESWRRLAFDPKNIQKHDIILIRHELKELSLVAQGVPQNEAHNIATQEFDYGIEIKNYYQQLATKLKSQNKEQISGAITRKKMNYCDKERW